jgi:hypothetical protein
MLFGITIQLFVVGRGEDDRMTSEVQCLTKGKDDDDDNRSVDTPPEVV